MKPNVKRRASPSRDHSESNNKTLVGELIAANDPVDGAKLLDDIERFLRRFIFLPKRHQYSAIALWALYTHVYDAFDHAPRLFLWSPVPGNGKSTLLRILNGIVRNGHLELNPTEAGLFRNIDMNHPTILLDEADKYLVQNSNGVSAVLNGGHMQGVSVTRNIEADGGYRPVPYNLFGPIAYAMKGAKPKDDLLDRSITIHMQKAPKGVGLSKFKIAVERPALETLRKRAEAWAKANLEAVIDAEPTMPPGFHNRIADNWYPLFAVAHVAGDAWPRYAAWAAQTIEENNGPRDSGLMLLGNIRQIFEEAEAPFLLSQALCESLNANEEWAWGRDPITPHRLASMLKAFGIRPEKRHLPDGKQARGYRVQAFKDAWELYDIQGGLGTVETLARGDGEASIEEAFFAGASN
jgi:hypothetical protein